MKILIAEDDRISRLLMQRILEADGGHALTMANDG
jgi:CheY-like chemotaxis protein